MAVVATIMETTIAVTMVIVSEGIINPTQELPSAFLLMRQSKIDSLFGDSAGS